METCYLIAGKIGDVLSVISRLHHGSNLVISKRYASIAQGIPGITPHIYDGEWDDLEGAIKWAKRKFKRVLVPQTFGKDIPIRHLTPGFQHDQWLRMGAIEKNGAKPIQIPRSKDSDGIVSDHLRWQKHILFAGHSQSSPFEHSKELLELLVSTFAPLGYEIIDLSKIKLTDFKDFLCLYNNAECLVSIDTAFLHLSAFSAVPTIALAADKPQSWHGSSDTGRFRFYCRYSDYQSRKQALIRSIQSLPNGIKEPEIKTFRTAHSHSYNPSIAQFDGKAVRAYRFHPNLELWPTTLAINDQQLKLPDRLTGCSTDDPRLFVFNGKLHCSYVFTPYPVPPIGPSPCAVGYGELVRESGWKLVSHVQVKYGKNNLTGQEKNWIFFEHKKYLHAIYQCSPEQIVLRLDGDKVLEEYRSKSPEFCMGAIRGGTSPIPYNGQWLRFFHTLVKNQKRFDEKGVWWFYYVGALLMNPEPPFQITKVSSFPVLSGDERYVDNWKFWKPRVTIPYGAIQDHDGWRVSVGVNDSLCGEAFITPEQLNFP